MPAAELRSGQPPRVPDLLIVAPLGALALYLLVFASRAGAIVRTLYLNADIASGPVISQSLASVTGHTEVLLGNYPWFEALGVMSVLRLLPAHRLLWEAAPFLFAAATAALVAWGTWRAAGRRAALLTLTIALAAAPATVEELGTWTVHGLTWLHAALLGWLAVWLAGERSRGRALLVAGLVGLVSGPALASDLLLVGAGLLPLWVSALVLALRGAGLRSREQGHTTLVSALLASALAAAGGLATLLVAHSRNIRGAGTLPLRITPHLLGHNLGVLWEALVTLGNGNVINSPALGLSTVVHFLCAALALIALPVGLAAAWGVLSRASSATAIAHAAFWGSAALALLAAFLFSNAPVAAFSGRYLVGVLLAAAALVPLASHRYRTRLVTAAAVTLFALAGVMSLLRGEMTHNASRFPTPREAVVLARFAVAEHAPVGYAGYWDAAPLTWASGFALHLYPVSPCGPSLCAFQLHRVASWYDPRRGLRSYLVLDRTVRQVGLGVLPSLFGRPIASERVGQLEVYVFAHDIAGDFGTPLSGPQP